MEWFCNSFGMQIYYANDSGNDDELTSFVY